MNKKGLLYGANILFIGAVIILNGINLDQQSVTNSNAATQTAAVSKLVQQYHTQTINNNQAAVKAANASKAATEAAQKELPILLNQIETAIAKKDNTSITTAVNQAVSNVEKYFAQYNPSTTTTTIPKS